MLCCLCTIQQVLFASYCRAQDAELSRKAVLDKFHDVVYKVRAGPAHFLLHMSDASGHVREETCSCQFRV
jgi:hypothetical protein